MAGTIERFNSVTGSFTLTNSASTSPDIPFGPASGGLLIVDAVASGATKINWYTAFTTSETAIPLYVDGAAASTDISAGRAYALPDALFAAPFVVGVTDAGTATIRLSVKG
jgi:hypothetical protein